MTLQVRKTTILTDRQSVELIVNRRLNTSRAFVDGRQSFEDDDEFAQCSVVFICH